MKKIRLDDIEKKQHPYQVPDGYFEDLTSRIQERTVVTRPAFQWIRQPRLKVAFASVSFLAVILIAVVNLNQNNTEDFLAGISDTELLAYVENVQFSESDILSGLESEEIDDLFEEDMFLEGIDIEGVDVDDLLLEQEILEENFTI